MKNLFTGMIFIILFVVLPVGLSKAECPGVAVTYYVSGGYDPTYGTYGGYPATPRYEDGSSPSYYFSDDNLVVTWPHSGKGQYTIYYVSEENGTDLGSSTVYVTIDPSFTSSVLHVCNSASETFTISDNCATSFSWSAPSGWSINGGSNTLTTSSKSVSITGASSGTGLVTISVTTNTGGSASTSVWFGLPDYVQINGSQYVTANSSNYYEVSPYSSHPSFTQQGVSNAEWSFPYGPPSGYSCNNCSGLATWISLPSSAMVTARAQNACGYGEWAYIGIIVDCGNDCEQPFSYYPNPASSDLIISFNPKNEIPGEHQFKSGNIHVDPVNLSGSTIERSFSWRNHDDSLPSGIEGRRNFYMPDQTVTDISLHDTQGNKVYTVTSSELQTGLKVDQLKNGIYFLVVKRNGQTYKRQIVVRH